MNTAQVFSFHGGIHPEENKTQSLQLPLGRPSLPSELILPLGQHIGQSSRPVVNQGDKVLKGDVIATSNGFLSSYLHAPTSGAITAIEERPIAHPSGLSDLCIVLHPDGEDRWTELKPLNNWQSIDKAEILAYLSNMGIVGMGGAGFPTQVKLQGAQKSTLSHFIINAAECEPYITADDTLMREKTHELISGIEVFQHLIQADKVIIGIEDNKPTAITAINAVIAERNSNIQVAVVPTKYPSGGEKQLIQLLTGQEVPSGKHPADMGILCQNVGTCVAVHDAIYLGKPLISRITTLTGEALTSPQNVEVLLGTPIEHLLAYADVQHSRLNRLILGGPMMGYTLDSAAVPIVKTTNCILAASKKEFPAPAPEQACIRCGMCEQACPASLLPQQLLWFSKSQEHEKAEHYNLFDCIECGACSYVCPSSIPLVQYYRHTKSSIRDAREANVKSDLAKQRFEARKARQEAEAAEKEAKRLARQKATTAKSAEPKKAAPVADSIAPTSKTAAPASPAVDDTKKLKVDVAIGKSKLKKLQKQLLDAQENEHLEDISALQLQVTDQENLVAELEKQLAAVLESAPSVAKVPVDDAAKKAKIDAAIAKAAVKKVEKALKKAEEMQAPEVDAIRQQLKDAQQRADELEQALSSSGSVTPKATSPATPASAAELDLAGQVKKEKIAVALANAQINKLTKRLANAPEEAEAIQAEIDAAKQRLQTAQALLNTLVQSQNSTQENR
ncbi:electron transport complex subunit RsxC [Marinomonas sp. A79]|uniref:Ion-translocating oxidoreductase complex subunit C n=1 Tax=Marinomonas vulgaris TaxID=2823372 RepID=A0ABS5HD25_9GAMM|nr:electron transport complex subunit RsxC [Marinomonas vulgaris]MBR7889561.1 electron transport complex subunit RsxC [Marinomonas vulgaris]